MYPMMSSEDTTSQALAVQESMLADLTAEQRARYDAALRSFRRTEEDGLDYCEACGYMFDRISYLNHHCN